MADNNILNRLDGLKLKFEEIGQQMTDPEVIGDMKKFVQLNKEYKELKPIIETSERYRTAVNNLREAKDILANEKDEDLREMAREEVAELEPAMTGSKRKSNCCSFPKTRRTRRTLSWRYAAAREATRRPSSPATCCACTPNMRKAKAGNTR